MVLRLQRCIRESQENTASLLLLTYDDPKHDLTVAAGASKYGTGALILYDGTKKAISHTTSSEDVVIAQAVQDAEADFCASSSAMHVNFKKTAEEIAGDVVPKIKTMIRHVHNNSWPCKPSSNVGRYLALRPSPAIQEDCLFFDSRVVVATVLRRRVLKFLNEGNPGTTRTKMLARFCV
ncbi:hypothetical protein OESDEN_01233 [Oesophagostomum dentatum]|uniref:Uncharacterized protein n=1 Tax=Oesophagostomum dentatum TaxID=61180 RepID=A0A0B1TMJ8_OESDE|nr:hypothetical protein OESDEN_01233 [Oesophagostomum dentatum]